MRILILASLLALLPAALMSRAAISRKPPDAKTTFGLLVSGVLVYLLAYFAPIDLWEAPLSQLLLRAVAGGVGCFAAFAAAAILLLRRYGVIADGRRGE